MLWYMKNKGRGRDRGEGRGIRLQSGGKKILIPVIWQKNSNVKTYSRYETLLTNVTDEITVALADMKQTACTVGISGDEMSANHGMAQKRDLLRDKLDIAELALQEDVERQLVQGVVSGKFLAAGNGGKDMTPIGALITKDTDDSLVKQEINQSTEPWWRNQFVEHALPSFAGFKKEAFKLYNDCSKGSTADAPDLIISDQAYFELWENLLSVQQRYGNYGDEDAASAGFQTIKLKQALMFWSDKVPGLGTNQAATTTLVQDPADAVAFYLNTRWMELVVADDVNFVATPFVTPYDQDAMWAKILLRAQFTIKQLRKFGVHYGVNASTIVS